MFCNLSADIRRHPSGSAMPPRLQVPIIVVRRKDQTTFMIVVIQSRHRNYRKKRWVPETTCTRKLAIRSNSMESIKVILYEA
jgi:hypothetical protein